MATNAAIFVFIESDGVIVIFSAGQHRYSAEIIAHCVWLYHRFPLSCFREVEELMVVRGVIVTSGRRRAPGNQPGAQAARDSDGADAASTPANTQHHGRVGAPTCIEYARPPARRLWLMFPFAGGIGLMSNRASGVVAKCYSGDLYGGNEPARNRAGGTPHAAGRQRRRHIRQLSTPRRCAPRVEIPGLPPITVPELGPPPPAEPPG